MEIDQFGALLVSMFSIVGALAALIISRSNVIKADANATEADAKIKAAIADLALKSNSERTRLSIFVDEQRRDNDTSRAQWQTESEVFGKRIAAAETRAAAAETRAAAAETRAAAAEVRAAAVEERAENAELRATKAEGESELFKAQMLQIQTEAQSFVARLSDVEAVLRDEQGEKARYMADAERARAEKDASERELEIAKTQIAAMIADQAEDAAAFDELVTAFAALRARITSLENQLKQREGDAK